MRRMLIAGFSLLCVSPVCMATQPGNSAACFSGQVMDSAGAGVAGVALTAKRIDGGSLQVAVSDAVGRFRICGLKPGTYRVSTHREDFEDSVRLETLAAGKVSSLTLDIRAVNRGQAAMPAASVEQRNGLSPQIVHSGKLMPPTFQSATEANQAVAAGQTVFQFRTAGRTDAASSVQDAPAPARRNLPHGEFEGLLGSTMAGAQDVTLRDEQLPIAEFGGSLGGVIGRGNTSYFASFDRFGVSQPGLMSIAAGLRGQTRGALPMDENQFVSSALLVRVDHRFNAKDSANFEFSRDDLRKYALRVGPDGRSRSLVNDLRVTQQSASAANTMTLSPTTVNETSAQFISTDMQLPAGAPAMGVRSDLPTIRTDRVFDAADNLYRQLGKHSLRAGGDFVANQMNLAFIESSLGRIATGNSSFSQSNHSEGLYVLGRWQTRPNLVFTSGLRYDLQSIPGFKNDRSNMAPEVGFAWGVTPRTTIRGGAGIYADQMPLPAIAGPEDAGAAADIQDSGRFISRNGRSLQQLASFTTLSPTMRNAYADHADVQVEQQIGARSEISAETEYVRGVELALPAVRTVALCASSQGCGAGNTFSGEEIGAGAVSSYVGTTVAYTQQPVRWGSYKVSYTYASAEGFGTGLNTSYASDHMRRASFTGSVHTSLDPASGIMQEMVRGFVLTGTGDYSSRTEFAGFNFINANARLTKTLVWGRHYRLEALAETFNAFERTNAAFARSAALMGMQLGSGVNSVYSTYRRVAALQSPNATQVGMRLSF